MGAREEEKTRSTQNHTEEERKKVCSWVAVMGDCQGSNSNQSGWKENVKALYALQHGEI